MQSHKVLAYPVVIDCAQILVQSHENIVIDKVFYHAGSECSLVEITSKNRKLNLYVFNKQLGLLPRFAFQVLPWIPKVKNLFAAVVHSELQDFGLGSGVTACEVKLKGIFRAPVSVGDSYLIYGLGHVHKAITCAELEGYLLLPPVKRVSHLLDLFWVLYHLIVNCVKSEREVLVDIFPSLIVLTVIEKQDAYVKGLLCQCEVVCRV